MPWRPLQRLGDWFRSVAVSRALTGALELQVVARHPPVRVSLMHDAQNNRISVCIPVRMT